MSINEDEYLKILKGFGFSYRIGSENTDISKCYFVRSNKERYTNVCIDLFESKISIHTNYRIHYEGEDFLVDRSGLKIKRTVLNDICEITYKTDNLIDFRIYLNDLFKKELRNMKLKTIL